LRRIYVCELLKFGADITVRDNMNRTPLDVFDSQSHEWSMARENWLDSDDHGKMRFLLLRAMVKMRTRRFVLRFFRFVSCGMMSAQNMEPVVRFAEMLADWSQRNWQIGWDNGITGIWDNTGRLVGKISYFEEQDGAVYQRDLFRYDFKLLLDLQLWRKWLDSPRGFAFRYIILPAALAVEMILYYFSGNAICGKVPGGCPACFLLLRSYMYGCFALLISDLKSELLLKLIVVLMMATAPWIFCNCTIN
jgi:hypothetical protein